MVFNWIVRPGRGNINLEVNHFSSLKEDITCWTIIVTRCVKIVVELTQFFFFEMAKSFFLLNDRNKYTRMYIVTWDLGLPRLYGPNDMQSIYAHKGNTANMLHILSACCNTHQSTPYLTKNNIYYFKFCSKKIKESYYSGSGLTFLWTGALILFSKSKTI